MLSSYYILNLLFFSDKWCWAPFDIFVNIWRLEINYRAEEPGRLQSMGSLRVGHDWATSLSLFTLMHWRRQWQPTPVFLPGESQGQGSLVGCRLWGRTESDTTEVTYLILILVDCFCKFWKNLHFLRLFKAICWENCHNSLTYLEWLEGPWKHLEISM